MECFSLSILLKYLQGQEDSGEHAIISAHLSTGISAHLSTGCALCHENLGLLKTVVETAIEDRSFDFSEEALAASVARFKEEKAISQRPIRQFIAKLIFDGALLLTGPQCEFADARVPPEKIPRRQVLYHAQGYDVDLLFVFNKEHNNERLIGQILPERCETSDIPQFKVQLLQHGSVISVTDTNDDGQFKFAQVVSGIYDLKVSVPEGEINLER